MEQNNTIDFSLVTLNSTKIKVKRIDSAIEHTETFYFGFGGSQVQVTEDELKAISFNINAVLRCRRGEKL